MSFDMKRFWERIALKNLAYRKLKIGWAMADGREKRDLRRAAVEMGEQLGLMLNKENRTIVGGFASFKKFRRKKQFVVGYSWVRPGASWTSGIVHDVVLGCGESYDGAVRKAMGAVYRATVES